MLSMYKPPVYTVSPPPVHKPPPPCISPSKNTYKTYISPGLIIGGLRYSLTIFRTVDVADTSICPSLDVSRIESLCTSINPEFGMFPGSLSSESESERSESSETTR